MTQHDPDDGRPVAGDEHDVDVEIDGRLAGLVRSLTDDDRARVDPPPSLWGAIAASVAADAPDDAPVADAPVVPMTPRRRVPRPLLIAAASVLVAGVAVGIGVSRSGDGPVAPTTLARAELEQLEPLGRTAASARLVDEDGVTHLVIEASDMAPPPEGSSYELWLIDPEVTDPRSLGVVTGSGDIVVPSSIDPTAYPIVDISLEPDDGDHAHSGHSLMRGTLA